MCIWVRIPMDIRWFPVPYNHLKLGTPGQEKGHNFLKVEAGVPFVPLRKPVCFPIPVPLAICTTLTTYMYVHVCPTCIYSLDMCTYLYGPLTVQCTYMYVHVRKYITYMYIHVRTHIMYMYVHMSTL